MTEQISLIATPMVALALGVIFIIMLVVVHKVVKDMSFFGDRSGWIVAACVAALSVFGLLRFSGAPGQTTHSSGAASTGNDVLDFVLLPYVVLSICVLLLLALRLVWPDAKPRHPNKGGRNLFVDDTQRVKKGTNNRPKASALLRIEKR